MTPDWKQLLAVWLRGLPQFVPNGGATSADADIQTAALGNTVEFSDAVENALAELARERVPYPNFDDADFTTTAKHPLSAIDQPLANFSGVLVDALVAQIRDLMTKAGGTGTDDGALRKRFFLLWRLLPERLAQLEPMTALVPADDRQPDHTVWHRADISAAFASAGDTPALLTFSLGPVQSFIAAARSLRDLWAGSFLLSWLTFSAMTPILEKYGPAALIFPALRSNAFVDRWLRTSHELTEIPNPSATDILTPSLPNTFVALVDASEADSLIAAVEGACKEEWGKIADAVHKALDAQWKQHLPTNGRWDSGWNEQINSFWDVRIGVLPWTRFSSRAELAERVAGWFGTDALGGRSHEAWIPSEVGAAAWDALSSDQRLPESLPMTGMWAHWLRLSGAVMGADKQIRPVLAPSPDGDCRPKCSLLGTVEQMGPSDSPDAFKEFWAAITKSESGFSIGGTHLHANEGFGAVALIKRFAWACYFRKKFGLERGDLRYPDTATVAARDWLQWLNEHPENKEYKIDPEAIREKHGDWNGQWLYWREREPDHSLTVEAPKKAVWELIEKARQFTRDRDGDLPSPYYAVLAFDGDELGKWLQGENAPTIRDVCHPKLVDHYTKLGDAGERVLKARRPSGPELHQALSAALSNFAQKVVPKEVEAHQGELIYAGGDDVLALFPTRQVLACAKRLRERYSGEGDDANGLVPGWESGNGAPMMLMGKHATASAGIAVAHYKADLRDVLEAARDAEKFAKNFGRDALGIAVMRRSGEHSQFAIPWSRVDDADFLVTAFYDGASDRWAYRLRDQIETLASLGLDYLHAELRRWLGKSERPKGWANTRWAEFKERVENLWNQLLAEQITRCGQAPSAAKPRYPVGDDDGRKKFAETFCHFVQAASFLARARDDR